MTLSEFNYQTFVAKHPLVGSKINYNDFTVSFPYLIEYTVEKKIFFLFKRKYYMYKPGYFVIFKDDQGRKIKEEWIEINKELKLPTKICAFNNNVLDGESLNFYWE